VPTSEPPLAVEAPTRTRTGTLAGTLADRTPRASIIIVNYNGKGYLDACLDSLREGGELGYEVILVDNASGDGSAEHVAAFHPQVRLIRSETNLGFGAGNNLGARYAQGEYLAFLNPDTEAEAGWLEALIAALEQDAEAGLATALVLLMDEPDRVNTCGNDMHVTGLTLCRGMGAHRDAFSKTVEVGAVSGAVFAIRRELFEALGGFDESFFLYVEDSDLSLRARLAGYRLLAVPGAVIHHDYRLQFGPQKTFYQERNRTLMLLKVFRWRTLLILAPALALGEVVTWGFLLLRERRQWAQKLRAYGWIMKHRDQILESRRSTQALRRVRDRDLMRSLTHSLSYEQTGEGMTPRLAHALLDPLFWLSQRLACTLVRW
jgi:GT2 family glycosyltransferase